MGLNQQDFCRLVGVEHSQYCALETLRHSPLTGGRALLKVKERRWRPVALKVAAFHCVTPEDLWPDVVLSVKDSEVVRKVSGTELLALAAAPLQPDEEYDRKELGEQVRALLGALRLREAEVLRRRFGIDREESTLDEIAADGIVVAAGRRWAGRAVTAEGVRQIELRALKRLRHLSWAGLIKAWS